MGITKKQKDVYEYIRSYTHTHGIAPTQKEIKEHFDLKSFGSVQRYLKYLTDAGLLESDWNARRGLQVKNWTPRSANEHFEESSSENTIELPLLGLVAAGNPIEAIENPTDTISIPVSFIKGHERHFALKVQGDSMIEDGIFEDDIIICKVQQTARMGERVVAVIDGEATVKKYVTKGKQIELHPANARLKPIPVDPSSDFRVVGKVVGLFRLYE